MVFKNRSGFRKLALLAVTLAVALTMVAGNIGSGTAAPPAQEPGIVEAVTASNLLFNYQGRLLDPATGNPKPNGSYLMSFSIYAVESLGSPLWTENRSVPVTGGLFSTLLGDVSPTPLPLSIFDGRALWLGVTVGADPEATPRMRLAYAPYALHAENAAQAGNADLLDGEHAAAFHNAAAITSGVLSTGRYSAQSDLVAEGYLGNLAGDLAQNNGVSQATLNADLLDGQHAAAFAPSAHNHAAEAITSGTLSTDRYSAIADLGAEGRLGTAGNVAQNSGTLQPNLNAALLEGNPASAFASAGHGHSTLPIAYGFVTADGTVQSGTGNVTSAWDPGSLWYAISISGYSYFWTSFSTQVTLSGPCDYRNSVRTGSVGGQLLVEIYDSAGTRTQCNFQFVTFYHP